MAPSLQQPPLLAYCGIATAMKRAQNVVDRADGLDFVGSDITTLARPQLRQARTTTLGAARCSSCWHRGRSLPGCHQCADRRWEAYPMSAAASLFLIDKLDQEREQGDRRDGAAKAHAGVGATVPDHLDEEN